MYILMYMCIYMCIYIYIYNAPAAFNMVCIGLQCSAKCQKGNGLAYRFMHVSLHCG